MRLLKALKKPQVELSTTYHLWARYSALVCGLARETTAQNRATKTDSSDEP